MTPPSTDPNWLYSTAAQSAAALVAIIGGLLATRLIGLATEREGLLRQAAELSAERDPLFARQSELRASRRATAREWFRQHYVELYVPNRGVLAGDVEHVQFKGSTDADSDEWHEELSAEVVRLFDRLEALGAQGRLSRAAFTAHGIDTPEFSDDVLDETIRVVNSRLPKTKPVAGTSSAIQSMMASSLAFAPPRFTPPFVIERQDREAVELAQVDMRVAELNAKVEFNADSLALVQRPPGVGAGLFALGAFALLGIGLPLLLMSLRPVPTGWFARLSVLVAFGVGLAVVVSSIAYQALQLRKAPTTPG